MAQKRSRGNKNCKGGCHERAKLTILHRARPSIVQYHLLLFTGDGVMFSIGPSYIPSRRSLADCLASSELLGLLMVALWPPATFPELADMSGTVVGDEQVRRMDKVGELIGSVVELMSRGFDDEGEEESSHL